MMPRGPIPLDPELHFVWTLRRILREIASLSPILGPEACETLLVAVEGLVFEGFPELPPSSTERRNSGFR
jgi:hypothetical protein